MDLLNIFTCFKTFPSLPCSHALSSVHEWKWCVHLPVLPSLSLLLLTNWERTETSALEASGTPCWGWQSSPSSWELPNFWTVNWERNTLLPFLSCLWRGWERLSMTTGPVLWFLPCPSEQGLKTQSLATEILQARASHNSWRNLGWNRMPGLLLVSSSLCKEGGILLKFEWRSCCCF